MDPRRTLENILPELVTVPAGTYPIGSGQEDDLALDDERPAHTLQLDGFQIGRFPLTVNEYRHFVDAGGYQDHRWWVMEDAQAWLAGEDPAGGPMGRILGLRQRLLDSGRPLESWAGEQNWKTETLQNWRKWTAMSEAEVRQDLASLIPSHSRAEPAWWNQAGYSGGRQPVVGVTWYEAHAYCAWLSDQSDRMFRLPSEVEWEAAMRGKRGLRYPWGDVFEAGRANTLEAGVLGTTAVDAYPGGVSPCGAWDGAGNVWEWTASIARPYPYRAEDGRETQISTDKRVLRGGSWYSPKEQCRCAMRDAAIPDLFSYYTGFRVAVT